MSDILGKIVKQRRKEIDIYKSLVSIKKLEQQVQDCPLPIYSLAEALRFSDSGIIAEFKRRSPSKKWINKNAIADEVGVAYAKSGAAAISVLTENPNFGGIMDDLVIVAENVSVPVLKKDFIIDEYQIYKARLLGASAILLIAAALTKEEVERYTKIAQDIGLSVLLELHHEEELDYILPQHDIIGINNRNLGTFDTDIEKSHQMASKLPKEAIWVSESGISNPEDIIALRKSGYRGFLIGENFMKTDNPGKALEEFVEQVIG